LALNEAAALAQAIYELEDEKDCTQWLEEASEAGLPFSLDTLCHWYPGAISDVMRSIDLGYSDWATSCAWSAMGLKSRVARVLSDNGILPTSMTAEDCDYVQRNGVDDDVALWILHAIPLAQRDGWVKARMSPEQSADWSGAGFTPAEAARWGRKKFTADVAWEWVESGFDLATACAWRSAGFAESEATEASQWRAGGVDPEVAHNRRATGIRPPGPG